MSVRGVWVISSNGSEQSTCTFSRRYPTVERRAKLFPDYCALPSDFDLMSAALKIFSVDHQLRSFSEERDSCRSVHSPPLFQLLGGKLKCIMIERSGLALVGVPCLTEGSVPCTLALLEAMAEILIDSKQAAMSSKLTELSQFLSISAPFGTPLDLRPFNVSTQLSHGKVKSASDQKSASWNAAVYRGLPRVTLCVLEEIRASQYDKPGVRDSWEVSGSLLCKAEVEGSPDIQLTLTTPTDSSELGNMVFHPIVHSDVALHHGNQRKLRFSATLESIPLLHYNVPHPPPLPIRGFYQMRGDDSVRLLIQLKLNERVRNSFEYCEVNIPFFNRGIIERFDSVVPTSLIPALALSSDSKSIVWNIGQKFPAKSLELSLQATVYFKEDSVEDQSFYVGSNSYIEVLFKMAEGTLSGATVDPKSINVFPSVKTKVIVNRELYSSSYRIWNSHGDSIATYPQLTR